MTTRDLVHVALFAAIVAVLGVFPPLYLAGPAVPITLQSMGVMLAGSILGARRGGLALVVFVLLVAAGLPLLSGGRGGLGVVVGPSGGYLLGYILGAFCIGYLMERSWHALNFWKAVLWNLLGGIGVVHALGIPWRAFAADLPLLEAAALSSVFIPGDVAKVMVASYVAVVVKRAYPLIAVSR